MSQQLVDFRPITPVIGAEILNPDDKIVSGNIERQLRQLLTDRKVLVFRNKDINPKEFLDFMKIFGEPYAEDLEPQDDNPAEVAVIEIKPNQKQVINFWHMDYSFTEKPAAILSLHAKTLPLCGGDTLFTNLEAAYEGLDEGTKSKIDKLQTNHRLEAPTQNARNRWTEEELEKMKEQPPIVHPLVCRNPNNGNNYLFVNVPIFCHNIVGMENEEGDELLSQLYRHAQRPEYSFRLVWEINTLVVWENIHCLHYPVSDYFPNERKLLRIALKGTHRPFH